MRLQKLIQNIQENIVQELKEERMEVCKKCEHYSARQVRCKECGCWLVQKIKFTNSKCPIDRW